MIITFKLLIFLCTFFSKIKPFVQTNYCAKDMHSPIDINLPYEYNDFNLDFLLNTIHYTRLQKTQQQVFQINEYFGLVNYENLTFNMEQIYIKYPAEHRVSNLGFSMEMQLEGKTKENQKIVICILFELKNDYQNQNLDTFFLQKNLSLMKTNDQFSIKNINLNKIVQDKNEFYMYQGQSTNQNCEYALIFVARQTEFIGKDQLAGYDIKIQSDKKLAKKPQTIYQNFLSSNDTYYDNSIFNTNILFHSDFYLPPEYTSFSYVPSLNSEQSFGEILNDENIYLPFWKQPDQFEKPPELNLLHGIKTFTYFYQKNNNTGKWESRYITVPIDLDTNFDIIPDFIPVIIRANYMLSTNNVRPLMVVNMPVIYKKIGQDDQSEEEIPNDDDIQKIIQICLKVQLDEVLNIPIDDIEALKLYKPDFEQKFQYHKYCIKKFQFSLSQFKFKTKKLELNFLKRYCFTRLNVILNRRNNDSLTDYVDHSCESLKQRLQKLIQSSKILQLFLDKNPFYNQYFQKNQRKKQS